MNLKKFKWFRMCGILALFALLMLPANLLAQEEDLFGSAEDDNLLFGEEFDLGGDDFSFDFEDESGTDDSFGLEDAEEGADSEEDDFFGESFEETAEEESEAEASAAEDEWGVSDGGYDDLMTRSVDGEDGSLFQEEVGDHPLDFRRFVKGTIFEGTGLTVSLYSPYKVDDALSTWYSYMDFSLTAELPFHYTFEPVDLSFSLDISSFNFTNSFPSGGSFKGVTIMPTARVETFGAELEFGLGMYYPTFGALFGVGYSYQFHSIFASAGYRWNWVNNIDSIGSSWWLEPRITAGIKLW